MILIRNSIVMVLLLSALSCLPAEARAGDAGAIEGIPPPAPERRFELPMPDVFRLGNGLEVMLLPSSVHGLSSATLSVKAGGGNESRSQAGLASMTGALLKRGNCRFGAEQLAEHLESLGGSLDVATGWDSTSVSLQISEGNLAAILDALRDLLACPAFEKSEIERLQHEFTDEFEVNRKDPEHVANWLADLEVFQGTRYAHLLRGTARSLAALDRDSILSFYAENFRPERATFLIATSLARPELQSLLEKSLGTWKPQPVPARANGAGDKEGGILLPRYVLVDDPKAQHASLVMTYPGPARAAPDYRRAYLLSTVLGGGYSSRLNRKIRIAQGLSYGVYSGTQGRFDVGSLKINAQTTNENLARVLEMVLQETHDLTANEIALDELNPRRQSVLGGIVRAFESNRGTIGEFAERQLYDLPLDEVRRYEELLRAVRPTELHETAARLFEDSRMRLTAIGAVSALAAHLKHAEGELVVIPFERLDFDSPSLGH